MKTSFASTPETPPADALAIIASRRPIGAPPAAAEPMPPPTDPEPEYAAYTGFDDEEDSPVIADEQRIPKSRFDQVNQQRKTAEARVAELEALHTEHPADDGMDDEFDDDTSTTAEARLAIVEQGFDAEQAAVLAELQTQHNGLSLDEATALARLRNPNMFSSGVVETVPVPASHGVQPPRSSRSSAPPPDDDGYAAAQRRGDAARSSTERDAAGTDLIRAIRARTRASQ